MPKKSSISPISKNAAERSISKQKFFRPKGLSAKRK
jgi:hypothetical protein